MSALPLFIMQNHSISLAVMASVDPDNIRFSSVATCSVETSSKCSYYYLEGIKIGEATLAYFLGHFLPCASMTSVYFGVL